MTEKKNASGGGIGTLLPVGAGGIAGAAAAVAVSWLDPFAGSVEAAPTLDTHSGAGAPPTHSMASATYAHDETAPETGGTVYELKPVIVSLASSPQRRPSRLRVVIGIEGGPGIEEAAKAETARLRDAVTAAARGLSAEELASPQGLGVLREALLLSARDVLGDEAVRNVLITDYVMN